MTDNQYIFFIGGKDLEMETIKQLLSAHNQPYIDKNLGWGAKTSAYEAEISQAAADGARLQIARKRHKYRPSQPKRRPSGIRPSNLRFAGN